MKNIGVSVREVGLRAGLRRNYIAAGDRAQRAASHPPI